MQKKKERTFEEKLDLYCFFINDINNYFEKKLVIENIPKSFNILDDLKLDTKIYKLIRKNNLIEMDRKEIERRKKIDNKRKGIKVEIIKKNTEEERENLILNEFNKSINNKSNLNPSYFGQINFKIIKHFFNSKNELIELNKILKKKIHDILYECYENVKDPFDDIKIIRKNKKNIIKKDLHYEEKKNERRNLKKNESEKLFNKKNELNLLSCKFHLEDNINEKLFHQILNNSLKINKEIIKDNEKLIENKKSYHSNINIFNKSRNIKLFKNNKFELYNTPINTYTKNKNFLFTNSRDRKFLNTNPNFKIKLLKPKTAIRRIQNISLDLNKLSNNFLENKNSFINNNSKPLFRNSLVRNAISESNFNLEKMKQMWDISERNERKPNERKIVYSSSIDGKNYDYSNLMSLRHIKLKTKFKKYAHFSLTKNVFFSKQGTAFPSLKSSIYNKKKKVYSIYNIRNNLKMQKMKGK